ncbi:hypothetical protein LCGC14_0933880 [marine sediment metagenome]|uniref:Uncharacterized protein n=1 Tax=marine sediment metagenome TaxID=412755 RepID=A0A0F9NM47_9ZZZZ
MTITYATLDQFYDEQPSPNETNVTAATVQKILEYGQEVVSEFTQSVGFEFAPRIVTKYRKVTDTIRRGRIRGDLLYLDEPLLAATTVTLGDATVLVEGTDFRLFPNDETPASALEMINTALAWTARIDRTSRIAIVGEWGWRRNYADAWIDSTDSVQDVSVTAEQTTITTTNADGADGRGLSPRFSPGNLIRIDSEFMSVVSISSETLTVVRGVRGSTAATHTNDTQIDVFIPEGAVVRAAKKQTAFKLAKAGHFTRVSFDGAVITTMPDVLPEVTKLLNSIDFFVLGGV